MLEALLDTAEPLSEWHVDDAPEEEPTQEELAAILAAKDRIAAGERLIPHEEARRGVFNSNADASNS